MCFETNRIKSSVVSDYWNTTTDSFQVSLRKIAKASYCTFATYFLAEPTSFFSCKTSSTIGGAIYFLYSGGQNVLHEVCCYEFETYTNTFSLSLQRTVVCV